MRVGRRPTSTLATLARAFAEEAATLAASEGPPLLALPFAERSRLEVSGVLRLTGRGAVDCELAVRGRLEAEGDDTALRGGRLELDGHAEIAEASVRGGPLHIVLAAGSTLRIGLAHAGVDRRRGGRRAPRDDADPRAGAGGARRSGPSGRRAARTARAA